MLNFEIFLAIGMFTGIVLALVLIILAITGQSMGGAA